MYFKSRFQVTALLLLFASLVLFNNCDGNFSAKALDGSENLASGSLASCGASQNFTPSTIDQAVEFINRLPKPLTVACFISHLQKPLKVYAVDNVFSAQPSQGPDNPRIFLLNGNFVMSVVPLGPGRDAIEFSQLTSTELSIKGEIPFPVTDVIAPSLPYAHIIEGPGRTSCRICHQSESRAMSITTGEAYYSGILEPDPFKRISQTRMLSVARSCSSAQDPTRCDILSSIYIQGRAIDQAFPTGPQ